MKASKSIDFSTFFLYNYACIVFADGEQLSLERVRNMRKKHVRDYVADQSVEGGYRYIGEYYIDKIEPVLRKKIGLVNILIAVIELILIFCWRSSIVDFVIK